jgi:hypothetical protein
MKEMEREKNKIILNKIWELKKEKVEEEIVVKMIEKKFKLKREKKIKKNKKIKKWKKYEKEKGIKKKKK